MIKEDLLPLFSDGKFMTPREITKMIYPNIDVTSSRTPELISISRKISKLYKDRILERRVADASRWFVAFKYRKK